MQFFALFKGRGDLKTCFIMFFGLSGWPRFGQLTEWKKRDKMNSCTCLHMAFGVGCASRA